VTSDDAPAFQRAVNAFDAIHAGDPRLVDWGAGPEPFAIRYHAVVARWVDALAPSASVELRLAARAQHLGRYAVPRASFPEGNTGYKRWRSTLARRQADAAAAIVRTVGFEETIAERVGDLIVKKRLSSDPEAATLEDAACLTFLEIELGPFVEKTAPDKVTDILQKTWRKMSASGKAAALALLPSLAPALRAVVEHALQE
jgi:hypothetical protein